MNRVSGDVCNSFSLQVLDSAAFELEYALLNNTGGNISFTYQDYSRRITKNFNGFVMKMSDSFIDNRVMLTIEGFVGLSFKDKFQRISFAWNTVPKFDWTEIFSDSSSLISEYSDSEDANKDDGGLEQITTFFKNLTGQFFAGVGLLIELVKKKNWDNLLYKSLISDPEGSMDAILDNLKVDKAGNYYLPNRKMGTYYSLDDTKKSKNVVQSGTIIIPMRPSNLIKFIAKGGAYSELLENDFEKYKGTAFYNGTNKVSMLDWLFIQKWYKRMGSFGGTGWKISDANIEKTDFCQQELTQTKQSYLQFIYKVLEPNSTITTTKTREITKGGKRYKQKVDTTKCNFRFYFDEGGNVYFKRIKISSEASVATTYYLYGNGETDIQKNKYGHMTAFSAELDVLTSMITSGAESGGDISNLNLVTGEVNKDYQSEVDPEDEESLTPFDDWGKMRVTVSNGASEKINYERKTLSKIQTEAMHQAYKATATIEGGCMLNPQDYIQITIIPYNHRANIEGTQSAGANILWHHTSGKYYILSIKESIEGGRQYSTLELVKEPWKIANTADREVIVSEKEIKYASSSKTILETNMDTFNASIGKTKVEF